MKKMKKILTTLLIATVALAAIGCSNDAKPEAGKPAASKSETEKTESVADDYPNKPITFIVPWSAGGSSDSMSRAIADIASKKLDTPINVVNRDGAGGTIATTEFKNAKADGYNISLEAVGVFTTQPFMREVDYTMDDFKPVIGLSTEPIVMVASKESGITSLEELVNYDGQISYGFSGAGSLIELSQKMFFDMAGIEADAIPFDGSSPTITALLGNHVTLGAAHPGEVSQYLESGDLVVLGMFSPERDPRDEFKDIPTFVEQGYDVDMSVWKFLIVPKDTPDEIVDVLNATMAEVLEDQAFIDFANASQLLITPFTPEEVKEKIANEAKVNEALFAN